MCIGLWFNFVIGMMSMLFVNISSEKPSLVGIFDGVKQAETNLR